MKFPAPLDEPFPDVLRADPLRFRRPEHRRGRRSVTAPLATALVSTLLLVPGLVAQQAGTVSGLVVDAETGAPVADALVGLQDHPVQVYTDAQGRFRLTGVPVGEGRLLLEHLGYGAHGQEVLVESTADLQLRILLSRQAIELTPLVVEALSELEREHIASGNRINQIVRTDIADGARRGLKLSDLLRQEMPGLRVRRSSRGDCVEYRGAQGVGGMCKELTVFVDGVRISEPSLLYPTMPLEDIERMEVLSPGQAGARYGSAAGWGVLLIETRRGPLPERQREGRGMISGFDWSLEPEPYPWSRVLGSTLVGNSVGVGLALIALDQCLKVAPGNVLRVQSGCGGLVAAGAGFAILGLPSAAGSLAAGWAGSTDRSRGRMLPAAVLGTVTVATGYLFLFNAETGGSDATRAAGVAMLGLATPLVMTFSDRVFRALR